MRRVLMPAVAGTREQRQRLRPSTSGFGARGSAFGSGSGSRHAEPVGDALRELLGHIAQLRDHALAHRRRSAPW